MAMNKNNGSKKASDGRVTTKKSAIDNNPPNRVVYMETGRKPKNGKNGKKKGY